MHTKQVQNGVEATKGQLLVETAKDTQSMVTRTCADKQEVFH
ncbi:MAG: hypothetical protein O7H41_00635 [Planctomycetota bacterium]|nr:hypothetical protein [Planctomycetota bacterium]